SLLDALNKDDKEILPLLIEFISITIDLEIAEYPNHNINIMQL
ncbi:hypothetical protein MNBD_ALPHA01-2364, partial [hydrothermal vent metagenome]